MVKFVFLEPRFGIYGRNLVFFGLLLQLILFLDKLWFNFGYFLFDTEFQHVMVKDRI